MTLIVVNIVTSYNKKTPLIGDKTGGPKNLQRNFARLPLNLQSSESILNHLVPPIAFSFAFDVKLLFDIVSLLEISGNSCLKF